MRSDVVVALPEYVQRGPCFARIAVELLVHLLGLERLMKPLQQSELRRRAVVDPHMRVLPLEARLIEVLKRHGYRGRDSAVLIQSFEVGNLKALRRITALPLVQLIWVERKTL